jgi:ATP-dependent exoDNAse (exonuclease V) beta subunit
MAAGALVHRLLEGWDGSSTDTIRAVFRSRCAAEARRRDVDPAALEREASEILDAFLSSDLAVRLRDTRVEGREVRVLLREEDGTTYRGNVDLLYRDDAGDLVIADFKTDRASDEDVLRSRHGAQLGIYAEAVREALALPHAPRAELWMLRHGAVIVL